MLPHVSIAVFSEALIVEAIYLRDLLTLVVSSKDRNTLGITNFETDEKCDGLDRVVSSINVVTHEQVVVVGYLPTNIEEFLQIVELTVYVTTNGNRCAHFCHITLILEYFLGMIAEFIDVLL